MRDPRTGGQNAADRTAELERQVSDGLAAYAHAQPGASQHFSAERTPTIKPDRWRIVSAAKKRRLD